jgi:hypothetical protein
VEYGGHKASLILKKIHGQVLDCEFRLKKSRQGLFKECFPWLAPLFGRQEVSFCNGFLFSLIDPKSRFLYADCQLDKAMIRNTALFGCGVAFLQTNKLERRKGDATPFL